MRQPTHEQYNPAFINTGQPNDALIFGIHRTWQITHKVLFGTARVKSKVTYKSIYGQQNVLQLFLTGRTRVYWVKCLEPIYTGTLVSTKL